ncbi:MAG: DNA-directed RNA polymerase subunit beta [Candidatus Eisenbacteria bacterium]|nr:DNA-directed RNA polymerase subunit beta [Candidatus Eisenbacteria bacterium]
MKSSSVTKVRSFSKLSDRWNIPLPNLLDVQLKSFQAFLQDEIPVEERKNEGLQEVFNSVFPITDAREMFSLEFLSFLVGDPKYSVEECQERDLTYSVPLKVKLRLRVKRDEEGVQREAVTDSEVYLGELPKITEKGTFIINGAERVIVSQLHRSPGVFFDHTIHQNGKKLYTARIIPYRGSWVEFSIDVKDVMYVHIDRKRKMPATALLKAMGVVSDQDIMDFFYTKEEVNLATAKDKKKQSLIGRIAAQDVVDVESGEILLEANEEITAEKLKTLGKTKVTNIYLYEIPLQDEADIIRNTLKKDSNTKTEEDAQAKIYQLIRPGEPSRADAAREILARLFFNPKRYDLASVGRYKLNRKLDHERLLAGKAQMKKWGLQIPSDDLETLCKEDFISIMKYLLLLRIGEEEGTFAETDDIDHLGNRRVRSVGELLANQFNTGLARMARIIRERMSLQEPESVTIYDFINARTISAVIQSFFGSSQLSQFMDQTNPLAELTHKRRLSALGPGGLTRDRAGFEVRDVHYTHYGRMCPIETPEGPNIGLISSLSAYARVNDLGFLETPYRRVKDGVVAKQIEYLSADLEDQYVIAQANEPLNEKGEFANKRVACRYKGEFPLVPPEQVHYMDVSPIQVVSPAAALIPFLEHDDANRALMGSNMQRQAVPLLISDPPLVGTGLERKVAEDSGAMIFAKRAGIVETSSGGQIVIKPELDEGVTDYTEAAGRDFYNLTKFKRSNQDTCINQRPLVKEGERVAAGTCIADGPSTREGELALGANVLVAFMTFDGYNFEDAIIVSEGLIKRDIFTSIHIEEFELQVRDTKRGVEEITREIPNVGDDALKNLDEDGIIRIGAPVRAGDILVGKVTPKGETDLTPEERLLRAIFGDKAGDVRDASLKAPPGMEGVVIDIKVFSRKEKDDATKKQERLKVDRLKRQYRKERLSIIEQRDDDLKRILDNQVLERWDSASTGKPLMRAGRKGSFQALAGIDFDDIAANTPVARDAKINQRFWRQMEAAKDALDQLEKKLEKETERVTRGDELPPGVIKLVKVYVAKKRKLSVGDKMAGRHGNKGVVSKIVPVEDMPFLPDGTPVQMVLNPLGVPSRMNIGQILEVHLGLAAHKLGFRAQTPVFAGAAVEEIKECLREAGEPDDGKTYLFDGKTGERFDQRVTVGYIYMMKLSHLVDDKIHARSIGPYSLVTQQPLGGKAQFGGQRFGEMEVWALEAYGAAHTLQELLTVKSDDVQGRSRIYEAIVKGENPPEPGVPESFNVLVKELKSLCLDVTFE